MENVLVTSVVLKKDVTLVDIVSTRMLGQFGFLAEVFDAFRAYRISIDVVATSEVGGCPPPLPSPGPALLPLTCSLSLPSPGLALAWPCPAPPHFLPLASPPRALPCPPRCLYP